MNNLIIRFGNRNGNDDFQIETDFEEASVFGNIFAHSSGQPHDSWQKTCDWVKEMVRREIPDYNPKEVIIGDNSLRTMSEYNQKLYLNKLDAETETMDETLDRCKKVDNFEEKYLKFKESLKGE